MNLDFKIGMKGCILFYLNNKEIFFRRNITHQKDIMCNSLILNLLIGNIILFVEHFMMIV